jgi:Protein of unknown function (DUF1460)
MIFNRKLYVFGLFLWIVLFLHSLTIVGQVNSNKSSHKISESIINNAKKLLGKQYQGGTLEGAETESLKYSADTFDCVTFVEYVLASSIYETNDIQNKNFEDILRQLRYRHGRIDGYGSRLHYFSEWIIENEKNGFIQNITPKTSSLPYKKTIRFMTSNAPKYPPLADKKELKKVSLAQQRISEYEWNYIPKNKINHMSDQIYNGDIIAITTDIKDLDIVHTGFAIRSEDGVHLLHASESEGKVVISKKTLHEYLKSHKHQSGILLLRVK